MAYQSNILSFDDARRASSRRGVGAPASSRSSYRSDRTTSRSSASRRRGTAEAFAPSASRASGRSSFAETGSQRSARSGSSSQRSTRQRAEQPKVEKPSLFSKLEDLKKSRSKAQAEKQFNKQYAPSRAASSESAGPRAALYKGEMGTSQRRATRLQDEAPSSSRMPREKSQRKPLSHNPFVIIATAVVACLVFGAVFLYPTAQQYYLALRQHDKLEAEYEAVLQRNDALATQLSALSSEEGLKAYVHDQYGWVSPGDNAVVVQGLNDGSENGLSDVAANVAPGSVKAPDTWYSDFFDSFFGYGK